MIVWLYIFLGITSLLYLCLTWNHNYWKKKVIPYLKPLPGIGNMLDIFMYKKSSSFVYFDMYRKFPQEPVCGLFEMCSPVLLVRSPDLIQTVLTMDFSSFHDNDFHLLEEVDPYLYKNPFCSTGADWKINRATLSPAFTIGKLKSVFPQMKEISQQMEDYLSSHLNEDIEAKELAYLFSSDIIANCAFGINGNSFTESDHVFKKMGKEMADRLHNPFLAFAFFTLPKLSQILKLRIIPETMYMFLKDAIMQVHEFRKKNNIVRNDFADFILSSLNNKKVNAENSDGMMLGHAITFFVEGIESSSVMSSFTLFELARNPQVQEKLRAEILSNFSTRENLELETLQKLPYLHKVVSESLRMYPVIALKKLCTQDTVLNVGGKHLKVEKGTPVAISVYGLHHDPKYFPNPEKFDPERFSEENISSRPKYAYLPFGEGPRMCIGLRFGMIQIKLFIISILLKYSVHCCGKTSKEVKLNQLDMFPSSLDGLWIKLKNK